MRKFLIIFAFLAVALGASAKFRWGPTVGANFSRFYWKQHLIGNSTLAGFQAGLMGELMIPGIGFGVDFGLKYANHGGRCDFGDQFVWSSEGIGDTDLRFHTIQIPIDLRFKWTRMNGIENYVAPFLFAGPVFNFNVGNTKCEAIDRTGGSVGIQCGIGAELWKRFQITGGYCWDVTYDTATKKLDNFSARIQGWNVDFTVLF